MRTSPRPVLRIPAQVLRGYCMGAADVVPGVSGGTVALVFGIYEQLVHSIKEGALALADFARLNGREGVAHLRAVDWTFLLPLLAGIATAVLTLAAAIEHLLEDRPVEMSAAFLGLVGASIVVAWGHLRRKDGPQLATLLATAVVTFVVLGVRTGEVGDPALWFVFVAGTIAICAMILPGVSGSFLLLMLGMYDTVLGAVNERDLLVVAVFGLGCVVGLASFSSLLDWLLRHHHDTVLAALIGLMAGSMRILWPWPAGTGDARLGAPPAGEWLMPLLIALAAGVAVLGVAGLGARPSGRAPARRRTAA